MHAAKDHEGVPLNLAVAHMGLAVFQGITRINTFSWAKIRKISFKRKKLLIKLHPEQYVGFSPTKAIEIKFSNQINPQGYYKDIVEFFFEGRNECKNFWKKCVENHGFFRCQAVQSIPRRKTRVLSRGSSFRYATKTTTTLDSLTASNDLFTFHSTDTAARLRSKSLSLCATTMWSDRRSKGLKRFLRNHQKKNIRELFSHLLSTLVISLIAPFYWFLNIFDLTETDEKRRGFIFD